MSNRYAETLAAGPWDDEPTEIEAWADAIAIGERCGRCLADLRAFPHWDGCTGT